MNGVLGPDQRVNVNVEFLPQDGRGYGMKLSVRVGASNNNIKASRHSQSDKYERNAYALFRIIAKAA
jgi:hypothetical protein